MIAYSLASSTLDKKEYQAVLFHVCSTAFYGASCVLLKYALLFDLQSLICIRAA